MFDQAPDWFKWGLHEIGVRETPGPKSTARILTYRDIAKIPIKGDDSDVPWCAIFANAALEATGHRGTRSAGSRSFEHDGDFLTLEKPTLGCIVTFWRVSKNSGLGHVGFYRGETGTAIYTLGGNQGDAVTIAPHAKNSKSFGFSGYYWPKSAPLVNTGNILMSSGAQNINGKVT